ncbi:MAG: hypothetical protein ACM3JB_13325 [Acidobacteriaceae bacterium]
MTGGWWLVMVYQQKMPTYLTPEEYRSSFKFLDEYVRTRYSCFVAEFFLPLSQSDYCTCFRPLGGSLLDDNRYACKYIRFTFDDVKEFACGKMPTEIARKLEIDLTLLNG